MVARKQQAPAETGINSVDDFERIADQIKSLESVLQQSRQQALALIASKVEVAKTALQEAEKVAKLANVSFTFEFGDVGQTFNGSDGYWQNSSYNC